MLNFVKLCLIFGLITYSHSLAVILTCGTCSNKTGCANNLCNKLVGTGLNQQNCITTPACQVSSSINLEVVSCVVDYVGIPCSTKFCYYLESADTCVSLFGSGSVSGNCINTEINIAGGCKKCSKSGCSNCYFTNTKIMNLTSGQEQEICFDSFNSTCNIQNFDVNYKYGTCTGGKDIFGKTCQCCVQTKYKSGSIGLCTSGNPLLASSVAFNQLDSSRIIISITLLAMATLFI